MPCMLDVFILYFAGENHYKCIALDVWSFLEKVVGINDNFNHDPTQNLSLYS